jgi:hypothetical protein
MSTQIPLVFNRDAFITLFQTYGQNLRNFKFYNVLISNLGLEAQSFLNNLLGVLDQETSLSTDITTFYNNWAISKDASENTGIFAAYFLSDAGDAYIVRWNAAQEMASYIIQYYFSFQLDTIPRVTGPSGVGFHPQTDNLYTFFQSFQTRGIGNTIISSMCSLDILNKYSGVDNQRKYVSLNPQVLGWCGCFSPDDPIALEVQSTFPKECDSLCVNGRAIKLVSVYGQSQLECNSAICVLSDVSLNVEGSTNRQYNFNQVCTACQGKTPDQPCRCIIDTKFASILSKISADDPSGGDGQIGMDVGVVFERYCPNSICYLVDKETGNVQTLPCNKLNPSATGIGETNRGTGVKTIVFSSKISFDTMFILMSIVIIVIFMCLMLIIKDEKKVIVAEEF